LIIDPASQAQIFATANGNSGGTLFAINETQFNNGAFGVFRSTPGAFPDGINAGYGNVGTRFVEGIDITAIYNLPTDRFGAFTFTLGYNHFFYYRVDANLGDGPTNFLGGFYRALPLVPGAVPYNKGFLRTEWDFHGFYLGATVNFVGDYHNDGTFIAGGLIPTGSNFQVNNSNSNPQYFYSRNSGSYVTLDLQVSYSFKPPKAVDPVYAKDAKGVRTQVAASRAVTGSVWQKLLWGTTIRAGVNNVFDKYPPFDAAAFNDGYDTSTYSIRNRFWYVGINKKF
jgi:outer membrane receptor protein involved in Fe transport